MAKQIMTDLDFNNVSKIINLPDPTLPQHPATKAYVDTAVEGLAWKDEVKVASNANINLASIGTTINGVTMANGDRFLAKDQTAQEENGIYVYNGAAIAATRALDGNSGSELNNAVVPVKNGGTTWRQTAIDPIIGTTSIVFAPFASDTPSATTTTEGKIAIATQGEVDAGSISNKVVTPQTLAAYANKKLKSGVNIGDGTATQIDVTHNLGTRDVTVKVYRNSAPYDEVMCDVEQFDVNTTRLRFSSAPAVAALRVVCLG